MSRSRDLADRINTTFLTPTGNGSQLTGIETESFKPVAVTGTTPSLDVGSYNFFDNGTLTANTTVSFASVPTNARWSYSFTAGFEDGWDISLATYSQNFSLAGQEAAPRGIIFKPDGLKMYVIGTSGDEVNEYDLSKPWNVSTASFLQLFSVATQDLLPNDVFFKPDGLKMYVIGGTDADVNEYNLSTAWDISTSVYLQNFSVYAQEINPFGFSFKPDGTKMYVIGYGQDTVFEYNLSTAWDVSSATYLQSFALGSGYVNPLSVTFKPDGTKMFICNQFTDNILEYNLSTAWNVTSAIYSQNFDVSPHEGQITSVAFRPDGTKMYVIGSEGIDVNEYNVGTATTVTLPAAVVGYTSATAIGDRVTYEFFTLDAGVTVNLIGEEIV